MIDVRSAEEFHRNGIDARVVPLGVDLDTFRPVRDPATYRPPGPGDPVGHVVAGAESAEVNDRVMALVAFAGVAWLPPMKHRIEETITYHDACHLAHAQKVVAQPRKLLEMIPGVKLVPLPESVPFVPLLTVMLVGCTEPLAGMMLAVSFLELLPSARRYETHYSQTLVGFLLGAVVMVLSLQLLQLSPAQG